MGQFFAYATGITVKENVPGG
ncbi:membrane protein YoeI [Escherichia coli]